MNGSEDEPRPIVILSGFEKGGARMDIELTPFKLKQVLEPHVMINPDGGDPFAMRISELQNALVLIDNAGDELA